MFVAETGGGGEAGLPNVAVIVGTLTAVAVRLSVAVTVGVTTDEVAGAVVAKTASLKFPCPNRLTAAILTAYVVFALKLVIVKVDTWGPTDTNCWAPKLML